MSENEKLTYLKNELWKSTIRGAFQARDSKSKIYKDRISPQNDRRDKLKKMLKNKTSDIIEKYYYNETDSKQHTENIKEICEKSEEYEDILQNDGLRIGISQKILNLYLKYLWCLDEIPEPPHCPIDSKIINKLEVSDLNWTQINELEDYNKIIENIKDKAEEKEKSIAVWELEEYNKED